MNICAMIESESSRVWFANCVPRNARVPGATAWWVGGSVREKHLRRSQHHSVPFARPELLQFMRWIYGFYIKWYLEEDFCSSKIIWNYQYLTFGPQTVRLPRARVKSADFLTPPMICWIPFSWERTCILNQFLRGFLFMLTSKEHASNHFTSGKVETLLGDVPGSGASRLV